MDAQAETFKTEIILATGIAFEDYLKQFAGQHCEWDSGTVIKMSPASLEHNTLMGYLYILFGAYFELKPIGTILQQPFTMRLLHLDKAREPDLMIVLTSNANQLTSTYLDGAAGICIEIISPESMQRDRGQKFEEYEKAGVKEYWLFDPIRKDALFYRLSEDSVYVRHEPDTDNFYSTPLLPSLKLLVPTLWQEKLPGPAAIVRMVEAML